MRVQQYNDMAALCVEVPRLIQQYEERDYRFLSSVNSWLLRCEACFADKQAMQASQVASLRGRLIAAGRGIFEPDFASSVNLKKSKMVDLVALQAIQSSQDILITSVRPLEERLNEAELIILQLIALADQKGLVSHDLIEHARDGATREIWHTFAQYNDLKSGLNKVLTFVSFDDALMLLEKHLRLWEPALP